MGPASVHAGQFPYTNGNQTTGTLSAQLCHRAWKSTETVLRKEGLLNLCYYSFNQLPCHLTPTAFQLDLNAENVLEI